MTTVNVVLTPGVDTDQSVSAQAQISAAPNGTLANPTIINMPVGRYRINKKLTVINKSHIRWTCLAGVPTYPNAPADNQAFVAYTDLTSNAQGLSFREHFTIHNCTNVIGSFLRIDGPNTARRTDNPLYAQWSGTMASDHGFALHTNSVDCGFEDCSWNNVNGDGLYLGGPNGATVVNCHAYRISGTYAGRMNIGLINATGAELIDITGDWAGFAGFDIEPLGAEELVWDAYCENIHMGSYFFPFTFFGREASIGTPPVAVGPGKKNITLKDSSVIRCASVNHRALQTSREAAGYLIIDGLTDLRNRAPVGIQIVGPWDDVTVKNCVVRVTAQTATTYAVNIEANDSYTVTDNNFSGTVEGFDVLTLPRNGLPPIYNHWGNVWAAGTQNDGSEPIPPVALFATSKTINLAGGVATLTVVPAPPVVGPPPATYFGAFIGGAPFRLRSRKGWGRMRGKAGARLRGSQGPAERHPMRLRSPGGRGRLRSATHPSYLRSMQPISMPADMLAATSGTFTLSGGIATLSTRLVATSAQLALNGTTATLDIVDTVIVFPAVSNEITLVGGDQTATFRHAVTSGTLTLAGSASTLNRALPATAAQIALTGGAALLSIGLAATSSTLSLAGSSAGLNGAVNFSATSAQIVLAGGTATLSIRTAATSAALTLTGGNATLSTGELLPATPGELALLGGIASLHILHGVGTGTITIHGGTAELGGNTILHLEATAATVSIHGGTATLNTFNQYPEWGMGTPAPEWEMSDA